METKSMDFQPWVWESDNWGGDPEGPLAKALERARNQKPKPLKLTKLPHRDQTSLIDYEEKPQKKEFKKDSCCCGATKKKPCKCMYTGAKCSSIKPMCACYKAKEESNGHMSFAEGFEAEYKLDVNKQDIIKGILPLKEESVLLLHCPKCNSVCDEVTDLDYVLDKYVCDGFYFREKGCGFKFDSSKAHSSYDDYAAEYFEAQATKIDWETDGQEVDLPKTVEVPDNLDADEIADYLSDEYDFLVNTFQIKDAESYGAELEDYTPEELTTSNVNVGDFMVDAGKGSYGSEEGYMADWENTPYSSWDDAWSDDVNIHMVEKQERLWLKNLTTIGVLAGAIYIGRKIKGV